MVPAGSVVIVIFGGAGKLMVIDRARVANCPKVSVTLTVKLEVPVGVVGVPEMMILGPVKEAIVRPGGSDPAVILQVSVPMPAVPCIVVGP